MTKEQMNNLIPEKSYIKYAGSKYKVAELINKLGQPFIRIYDEPPSKHTDLLRMESCDCMETRTMIEAEKYLGSQGLERRYNNIEISFDGMIKHLEMFAYLEQERAKTTNPPKDNNEAAEIIQHLKAYGMISPVTGVIHPEGTHKEFIKRADEWLWKFRNNTSKDNSNQVTPDVINTVKCVICKEPLTDSEIVGDGNCCDKCWSSN